MTNIQARKSVAGFTLTELAIVLGIIGLILGAIWVAASKVYQNNRANTAVKEAETILGNYRSMFTTHQIDTGDWADLTCVGVQSGYFPEDMLLPGTTCTAGNSATYPQHPWNGYVDVTSVQSWGILYVQFVNLPQTACNQLGQQFAAVPDATLTYINGTWNYMQPPVGNSAPWTSAQVGALCQTGNANTVLLGMKMR